MKRSIKSEEIGRGNSCERGGAFKEGMGSKVNARREESE